MNGLLFFFLIFAFSVWPVTRQAQDAKPEIVVGAKCHSFHLIEMFLFLYLSTLNKYLYVVIFTRFVQTN